MKAKDTNWIVWGIGMCVAFGLWQQSLEAGIFAFYATVFVLLTIAGWNED